MFAQSQTNAMLASSQQLPVARRPTGRGHVDLTERIVDPVAQKVKEDFLHFLQHFREDREYHAPGADPTGQSQLIGAVSSSMPFPTSDLLTPLEASPRARPGGLGDAVAHYVQLVHNLINDHGLTLYVDFSHLLRNNHVLANAIVDNFYRFEPFLREAVHDLVESISPTYVKTNNNVDKDFWASFYNLNSCYKMRELNGARIGQLLRVKGTVTRTSEVRPELLVGTFRCNECLGLERSIEQQFKYTEPSICSNSLCNNRTRWTLVPELSKFANWQRVRLQEDAEELPPGSMPRTLDIIVRNDVVEKAKPGDKCFFTGVLIVVPDVSTMMLPTNRLERGGEFDPSARRREADGVAGLKALGVRELTHKLAFLALYVDWGDTQHNLLDIEEDAEDAEAQLKMTPEEIKCVEDMARTPNLYERLVSSLAPSIFGHQEIKAGILLMLLGGVHKRTPEGINLRGDINVCIVGDPGTAKSQLLRYATGLVPRGIYTSGKASSAAGLTASVMKDEETGDFTIEAGALMLADNGLCAIDEFDKMDLKDQVAIHEAMEQQTISISKAGIQATLNARTSILAAANPVGGRYDPKRTLRQNIAMSAPIMSRFDLFFVLVDEFNESHDYNIARHLLTMHRISLDPPDGNLDRKVAEYSIVDLQRYIRFCRTIRPKLDASAAQLLVEKYKQLRANDATGSGTSYRITVRQLESLIRLSEALAKLHADHVVRLVYVEEACRLLRASIIRVETDSIDLDTGNVDWTVAASTLAQEHRALLDTHQIPPLQSSKLQISFDEYKHITNLLVYQLRRVESLADDYEDSNDLDDANQANGNGLLGMLTKGQLIQWYLESQEESINTEAELAHKERVVRAVIDRLLCKDDVLVAISTSSDSPSGDNVYLGVHPNYVF